MAYQAVIHGAKGLFYYGQVHCTKPNSAAALYSEAKDPAVNRAEFAKCLRLNRAFWERHRPFFRELSRASALFVLRDAEPARQVRLTAEAPKAGAIEAVTRRAGEHLYHLSVNASAEEREATFRLPDGVKAGEVHVLFEDRTIPVKDRTFTDRFKPYDVHVYATTAELPRAE
jgi:hypothetical protein